MRGSNSQQFRAENWSTELQLTLIVSLSSRYQYLILLCFALLSFTDIAFLLIEGKALHKQEDYSSLYCYSIRLTAVFGTEPTMPPR